MRRRRPPDDAERLRRLEYLRASLDLAERLLGAALKTGHPRSVAAARDRVAFRRGLVEEEEAYGAQT